MVADDLPNRFSYSTMTAQIGASFKKCSRAYGPYLHFRVSVCDLSLQPDLCLQDSKGGPTRIRRPKPEDILFRFQELSMAAALGVDMTAEGGNSRDNPKLGEGADFVRPHFCYMLAKRSQNLN